MHVSFVLPTCQICQFYFEIPYSRKTISRAFSSSYYTSNLLGGIFKNNFILWHFGKFIGFLWHIQIQTLYKILRQYWCSIFNSLFRRRWTHVSPALGHWSLRKAVLTLFFLWFVISPLLQAISTAYISPTLPPQVDRHRACTLATHHGSRASSTALSLVEEEEAPISFWNYRSKNSLFYSHGSTCSLTIPKFHQISCSSVVLLMSCSPPWRWRHS